MLKNKYDIVIVGAGLAGFAAATEAADNNLDALLVEKGKTTGGSGNYVEGVFAADSDWQKEKGLALNPDDILKEELNYSHYKADARMWKKYIGQAGKNIKWLSDHNVKFETIANLGTGARTWHLFDGLGHDAIHNGLEPYIQEKGLEIITLTRVTDIKANEDHSYTLTLTNVTSKEEQEITAKNVVLAAGGYLNNAKLLSETPRYNADNIIPVNSGKDTGDGLKLAWSLGAKKFFTGMTMMYGGELKEDNIPSYKLWDTNLASAVCDQPQMWVNESGERFVDENAAVDNWANEGNSMNRQERIFCIFDQKIVDDFTNKSFVKTLEPFVHEWTYPDLKKDLAKAESEHHQYFNKADTIEELAKKINTPELGNSINKYNSMAEDGEDSEFNKPAKYLLPIKQGPFYAIELGVGAFTTGDGLRVNLKNEVLDTEGLPMKGLYAIGSDGAGVLYGDTYGVEVPGSHAGYCVFSGRNAIKSIMNS